MTTWKRLTKPPKWHPRRGDVCLIALDKECPALVLSNDSLNAFSLDVCVLPISTAQHKNFSLRPRLKAGEAGLKYESWVKCDQPMTVEKGIVAYPPLGSLSSLSMQEIEVAVKTALDLP